jgi:hypothetical protein
MKNNLFLLIYILPLLIFSQNTDYSGKWTDSSPASTVSSIKIIPGEKFENTLTLVKIKDKENLYKFTFFGWRDSYDRYARQVIKFSGEMLADHFVIEVIDNKAYYNDDSLVEDGNLPLYSEGEERCKVYFTFNKDSITVQTLDCNFIYGGFGVTFNGTYKKN